MSAINRREFDYLAFELRNQVADVYCEKAKKKSHNEGVATLAHGYSAIAQRDAYKSLERKLYRKFPTEEHDGLIKIFLINQRSFFSVTLKDRLYDILKPSESKE